MAAPRLLQLREELALLPGPSLPDGQPTWTLHDPIRNLFFQLDWPTFEILYRWHLDDPGAIVDAIRRETTLDLAVDDVQAVAAFLHRNELLQLPFGSAGNMAERLRGSKGGKAKWLLHNYLFFRMPLVKPDGWLSRWVGRLDFIFSRTFLHLTLLAALLGLASVYRSWDTFSTTLVDMLSWDGMVAYGIALVVVKTLHELGHGLTAKRFGCRVPTMGVAFLVLWPVAYTDTNDVWKLTRRDQRLKVAAAGIATELAIAAWATLAWVWLPQGWPKSIAFLLSTTTWVSTIAVNASPFMRFDGYFLLSDYLQLPNLHARSFALARWFLREKLFALGEAPPEDFSRGKTLGLILFAWATWVYRLALFLGIAVLVYHFFIKAVGIFLFLVEIVWFVLMPLWFEIKAWKERWPVIRRSRRARRAALVGLLALALFVLPWPNRVNTSGLLQPQEQWAIYAPEHAQVVKLPYANGSVVPAGTALMELYSPQIQARAAQSDAKRDSLSRQSASAGFDPELRRDWQMLNEQRVTAEAENRTVVADAARYTPLAPYEGVLRDVDPDLREGDWVAYRETLGVLVRLGPRQVVTYVDDEAVLGIQAGDRALFTPDGLGEAPIRLEVAGIDRDASRTLNEPALATLFGGHVQVREKQGIFYPERPMYRVLLKFGEDSKAVAEQYNWRGRVTIAGRWEAPGLRFVRAAASVFWREMGF